MKGLQLRAAAAADLDAVAGLLGRPVALPSRAHEHLLLVETAPVEDGAPQLLATLRLMPSIGLDMPRLWYHVGCTVHAAPELGLFHRQRSLLLGHDLTGASELADIAWLQTEQPLASQAAALRLLVHGAWMLLARHRSAYAQSVVAELPGERDSAGQSPFWLGLGRHFYSGDPARAAAQHGPVWRTLVAALLPKQPLMASFLAPAAQAAIGQAHPGALVLREVLEAAGLRYSHHVNLEDAGPVLQADTDQLPGIGSARAWPALPDTPPRAAPPTLLMAGPDGAWRALRGPAQAAGLGLQIGAPAMTALGLAPGDPVWALALAPGNT